MALIVLVLISSSFLSQAVATQFQQAALYRDKKRQVLNGNFKADLNHQLSVAKIGSSLVDDSLDCTFKCVSEPKCKSFNFAANQDSNGLYLCELLETDKYRTAESNLQSNAAFHHFSPWSSCQRGLVGIHCERKGKSCSEIKYHSPQTPDGSYTIDPDGEGGFEPFTVFCDMTDKNGVGVTVIGHDSEARIHVNGYEGSGSYVRNVHYLGVGIISVAQIAVITDVSTHCEQFIKYECYDSALLYMGNPSGWWVSRDNAKMKYWGGATSANPYKCACGVTSPNSCVDPARGCNCDWNDGTWREDSGFLTEKSHLPVLQLKFGDTGSSSEQGYHTLGKLKCYGLVKVTV